MEVSSLESEKGASGDRVDMIAVLLTSGADAVAVAAVLARASALISGIICSRSAGEEN